MKASIKFAFLALFASILLVGIASADLSFTGTPSYSSSVAHDAGSFQIGYVINNNDLLVNPNAITWTYSMSSGQVSSISSSITSIAPNAANVAGTVTVNFPANQAGLLTGTITATPQTGATATMPFSVTIPALSTLLVTSSTSAKVSNNYTGSVTLKNTGNTNLGTIDLTPSSTAITISTSSVYLPTAGTSTATFTFTVVDPTTLKFGSTPFTITSSRTGITGLPLTVYAEKSFCSSGQAGNAISDLVISDITNNGEGEDDSWMPLDTITVDVDFSVTPQGDEDEVGDVVVELALYDSSGNKKTGDLTFLNADEEKIELGDLDSNSDATFEFQVSPDMKAGKNYMLAVKVYSEDEGQENVCVDRDASGKMYQSIDVKRESDEDKYIVFDEVAVSPTQATCGDTVTLNFRAYNIGDEDADQDRVKFTVLNKEMNLSDSQEITGGLDSGDNIDLSTSFIVPTGLKDKTYNIEINAEYDYDDGEYDAELDKNYVVPLKVFGCTPVVTKLATITAEPISEEALAGSPLEITLTVTNPGTSTLTYDVAAKNYDSWADSVKLSSESFSLAAGASKDIILTFQIASDAEGEQSFDFQVSSSGKTESKEIVGVDITKPSTGLSSILAGKSSLFWIIVAANVILILLIIIVAVRLASK